MIVTAEQIRVWLEFHASPAERATLQEVIRRIYESFGHVEDSVLLDALLN